MANEEGIVIRLVSEKGAEASTAWVKTTRTSACKSCSSRHSCREGNNGREMEVEALNMAGAKVGDRIVLNIKTASLLKATFLLYIFPVLSMLCGALIGEKIALARNYNESMVSVLFAFLFFVIAFVFVRIKGNRLATRTAYRPKIVRVLRPDPPQNHQHKKAFG